MKSDILLNKQLANSAASSAKKTLSETNVINARTPKEQVYGTFWDLLNQGITSSKNVLQKRSVMRSRGEVKRFPSINRFMQVFD